jgi:hypothetical protein
MSATNGHSPTADLDAVAELGELLRRSVSSAVEVSEGTLDVVLATLLAGGHLLIEDHPGVGKTMLARALAARMLEERRFASGATTPPVRTRAVWRALPRDSDSIAGCYLAAAAIRARGLSVC